MSNITDLMRPEIVQLKAYQSARKEYPSKDLMIQLDANENPLPEGRYNRYPEPQPEKLLETLKRLYQVEKNNILVTRGADEGIELMIKLFCRAYQDSILIIPPTFGYYRIAAEIYAVSVLESTIERIVAEEIENLKMIFLCSPNNPTGESISLNKVEALAKHFKGKSLIVVDEAYIEFSTHSSASCFINQYDNVCVLRTLSKAYGMAGLRIGAVLAHPTVIEQLKKIIAPYPIPKPSSDIALEYLSAVELSLVKNNIQLINQEKNRLMDLLTQSKEIKKVYSSEANFLLVECFDANKTYLNLLSQGILVRNKNSEMRNTLRISVGTPEENNLLLQALSIQQVFNRKRVLRERRKTQETEISLQINLDQTSPIEIKTGIDFFDHMLEQLAKQSNISILLLASGDIEIDAHHLVEDVAIVLGTALKKALSDKKGIGRFGFLLPMDEALSQVALDICNRGFLVFEVMFPSHFVGSFATEMVKHFFYSFAINLGASLHIQCKGENTHHMIESIFKAVGKCLKQAIKIEGNQIPSTKGIL